MTFVILSKDEASLVLGGGEHPWDSDCLSFTGDEDPWDVDIVKPLPK